jgi:hypothetical protein
MFAARISYFEVQRTVLLRWNFAFDYCGCDHGFHGTGSELHDVAAI